MLRHIANSAEIGGNNKKPPACGGFCDYVKLFIKSLFLSGLVE
jgi:hypothetical protein